MFCVWSGDYRAGDVLGGKYTVLEVMGRGSNGVTYKVRADSDCGSLIPLSSQTRPTAMTSAVNEILFTLPEARRGNSAFIGTDRPREISFDGITLALCFVGGAITAACDKH